MSTVWSAHSGWRIESVCGIGMGGTLPIIEIGAGYDGINFVIANNRTGQKAMFQGEGLGLSAGVGLSPFNITAAGPMHATINNLICTWPKTEVTLASLEGPLYVFSCNAEFASMTQNAQLWYFRGKGNYYPPPFGSLAAAVVAGEGASTELAAGSMSGMRYNITLIRTEG